MVDDWLCLFVCSVFMTSPRAASKPKNIIIITIYRHNHNLTLTHLTLLSPHLLSTTLYCSCTAPRRAVWTRTSSRPCTMQVGGNLPLPLLTMSKATDRTLLLYSTPSNWLIPCTTQVHPSTYPPTALTDRTLSYSIPSNRLTNWLTHRLTVPLNWLTDWLTDWLIDWLTTQPSMPLASSRNDSGPTRPIQVRHDDGADGNWTMNLWTWWTNDLMA